MANIERADELITKSYAHLLDSYKKHLNEFNKSAVLQSSIKQEPAAKSLPISKQSQLELNKEKEAPNASNGTTLVGLSNGAPKLTTSTPSVKRELFVHLIPLSQSLIDKEM